MLKLVVTRLLVMILTMACLSMIVFYLVNLDPNLRKLSISQTNMRAADVQIESWLVKNGYREPFLSRYGQWLGVMPKQPNINKETGKA
jgi:peptide/nickel transport system permease protein